MKIALLATGDELTNGDILNTNGQIIAQKLFDEGFKIGTHAIVSDVESDIIASIHFLQTTHQIIIITGGLGPTSDDRTRFALAAANQLDLFFDEASWQDIIDRITRYGLKVHPANKQQALFPTGAIVLPNINGSAPGCKLHVNNTIFFMLPGPPRECLPMFDEFVLSYLIDHHLEQKYCQKSWRLFGLSEGEIAAELDTIAKDYPVSTGYRWDYPYLEFKIRYEATADIDELIERLNQRLEPHCICTAKETASEILIKKIANLKIPLTINDTATGSHLACLLMQPETYEKIVFVSTTADITISGLEPLWRNQPATGFIELKIQGNYQDNFINEIISIPFRNRRVIEYAVEIIAYHLGKLF